MRKLYLFNNSNQPNHNWNHCYAMTDDGVVLGSHICSHSDFMRYDLYEREYRKEYIDKYFGEEPYEVEIIKDNEVTSHLGLQEAVKLNQQRAEEDLIK